MAYFIQAVKLPLVFLLCNHFKIIHTKLHNEYVFSCNYRVLPKVPCSCQTLTGLDLISLSIELLSGRQTTAWIEGWGGWSDCVRDSLFSKPPRPMLSLCSPWDHMAKSERNQLTSAMSCSNNEPDERQVKLCVFHWCHQLWCRSIIWGVFILLHETQNYVTAWACNSLSRRGSYNTIHQQPFTVL